MTFSRRSLHRMIALTILLGVVALLLALGVPQKLIAILTTLAPHGVMFALIATPVGLSTAKRYIGTITNTSPTNANSFFMDLPRDFPLVGLELYLSGTLNITGGTTNGTVVDENPMTFLRKIYVNCSGGPSALQLKNYKGIQAHRIHHLLVSRETGGVGPVTSGAVAATAFQCVIPVEFALPGAQIPPEIAALTVLNGREWTGVQLQLDMGDNTDFVNGGDRTVGFTGNVTVDVYGIVATNLQPKGPMTRYVETMLTTQSFSAIATENQFNITWPLGKVYRYMLFRVLNQAGNVRQPLDDWFGTFKLKVSQTEIMRFNNFRLLVERNRRLNDVQDAVNPSGLDALSSRDNSAIGYYPIDFAEQGRLQGALNATNYAALGLQVIPMIDSLTASARQVDAVAGFLQKPVGG